MFKPKSKSKPIKYVHTYRHIIPMDIKKQIYDLNREGELTIRQIADRFGLSERTCSSIAYNYPRLAVTVGTTIVNSTNTDRIIALELRLSRIERELNI